MTADERESAMHIAREWADLPPEHLKTALAALEPELQRAHAERLERMRLRHARWGMGAGFVLALAMLAAAVVVGVNGQVWLAALLSGPTLLAVAKVFVLNRSDTGDARVVGQSSQTAIAAPQPAPDSTTGP